MLPRRNLVCRREVGEDGVKFCFCGKVVAERGRRREQGFSRGRHDRRVGQEDVVEDVKMDGGDAESGDVERDLPFLGVTWDDMRLNRRSSSVRRSICGEQHGQAPESTLSANQSCAASGLRLVPATASLLQATFIKPPPPPPPPRLFSLSFSTFHLQISHYTHNTYTPSILAHPCVAPSPPFP